jgi:Uma2 family endonuclease
MVAPPYGQRVSIEEYFKFLRAQPEGRYEYIDGVISPVAAAGGIHEYLCSNLGRLLGNALLEGPCVAYGSNRQIHVAESKYVCPDAVVSCDPSDLSPELVCHSPQLVIEILSPGSERYDRHQKSEWHRRVASIQEIVLVDTREQAIEILRHAQNEFWMYLYFGPGSVVEFESLGLRIPIDEIYGKVTFASSVSNM